MDVVNTHCSKCLNISDEVYKYMNRDDNMWFCGTCLAQLRDFVKKGLISEWERDYHGYTGTMRTNGKCICPSNKES